MPSEMSGGTIVQQTMFSPKKVAKAVSQPCVHGTLDDRVQVDPGEGKAKAHGRTSRGLSAGMPRLRPMSSATAAKTGAATLPPMR